MKELKKGDVTNYGRIESITPNGHFKIEGRNDIVGNFREVFRVNVKNEEEVKILTKYPLA